MIDVTLAINELGKRHRLTPQQLTEAHALNGKLWREGCETAEEALRYVRKRLGIDQDPKPDTGPPLQA